ncbi:MAG: hypothetical protein QW318_07145 [Candidatus Caldarchaeum sp.]
MVFPVAPGRPNFSGTFIPEIWSGKVIKNFYDATVLTAISNTDYEGEIRKYGDTVNIRTMPEVTLRRYTKGDKLVVETPEAPKIQLLIDKSWYFQVNVDDVDKVQMDLPLLNYYTQSYGEQVKINIDRDVLHGILPDVDPTNRGATAGAKTQSFNLGTTASPITLSKDGAGSTVPVIDFIVDCGVVLDENNIPDDGSWYMVIPAKMAGIIKKSELKDASLTGDSQSPLRNGRIGRIDRFTLYTSHNLKVESNGAFNILFGHKYGLTFATQMTNTETIRAESTFGSLVRGLVVYGYKVVKPTCIGRAVALLQN